jgi:hypothetical protein
MSLYCQDTLCKIFYGISSMKNAVQIVSLQHSTSQHHKLYLYISHGQLIMLNVITIKISKHTLGVEVTLQQPAVRQVWVNKFLAGSSMNSLILCIYFVVPHIRFYIYSTIIMTTGGSMEHTLLSPANMHPPATFAGAASPARSPSSCCWSHSLCIHRD